jgi:two-component system response regulator FlrC
MQLLSARCRPGEQIPALGADAAHLLLTYPWPGNVRELDNLLQRALILVNGPVINQDHIQFELANEGQLSADTVPLVPIKVAMDVPAANSLARSLDETERDLILDALRTGQGSRREVAERLGISQRTLRYKLARLREAGVDVPAA